MDRSCHRTSVCNESGLHEQACLQFPFWFDIFLAVAPVLCLAVYIWVLVAILRHFHQLNNPFYICVLSLAVVNITSLVTMPFGDHLHNIGFTKQYYKIFSFYLTVVMQGSCHNVLCLASNRFVSLVRLQIAHKKNCDWKCAIVSVCIAWTLTLTLAALAYCDYGSFHVEHRGDCLANVTIQQPWAHLQKASMFGSVALSSTLYLLMFALLIIGRSRRSAASNSLRHSSARRKFTVEHRRGICAWEFNAEYRLLAQSAIIVLNQLFHTLAVTDTIPVNRQVNHYLVWLSALLCQGFNPFLYLAFSSEIRAWALCQETQRSKLILKRTQLDLKARSRRTISQDGTANGETAETVFIEVTSPRNNNVPIPVVQ